MKILQTVIVKQILTEQSKLQLEQQYNNSIFQYEKEHGQLLFEMKKLQRANKHSKEHVHNKFTKEMNLRKNKISALKYQLEQLDIIPIGSEIKIDELEALIEINVGDQWDEKISSKTIIIEEGIVKEIR